ncbi:MAG: hypothetical protein CMJ65_17020 [Planctomycetaceae bacterium]|jgi:hypothetical protein|nr:hypothetical protein [Planctomycetaceae bacterium]MDP7275789.1 hypothetical protein [Planctomycetaceae bacterium]
MLRTTAIALYLLASCLECGSAAAEKIRKYETRRLTLYSDVAPATAAMLLKAFDDAWRAWVADFGPPPGDSPATPFRITGCLMADLEGFSDAGLLPEAIERFLQGTHPGKHRGSRFWMKDQRGDYYRRHLMVHEATHCFMTSRGGPMLPVWYLEGTAELYATHVFDKSTGRWRFAAMPVDVAAMPGWGRLGMLRRDVRRGRLPRFDALAGLWKSEHEKIETYAWSWAFVRFLASHPTLGKSFRELGRHLGDGRFEATFERVFRPEFESLQFEWQLAARDLVPGFDFRRAAIRFRRSQPLPAKGGSTAVVAGRGWQSTGLRLRKGRSFRVVATGRFTLAEKPRPWVSTADGISFRYHAGLPLGRLVGVVQPKRVAADRPPKIHSLGSRAEFVPETDGTLFLRLNDFFSELADNTGTVDVEVVPSGP